MVCTCISCSKLFVYSTSCTHRERAIYSASAVLNATLCCIFYLKITDATLIMTETSDVGLRSYLLLAQSASVYALSCKLSEIPSKQFHLSIDIFQIPQDSNSCIPVFFMCEFEVSAQLAYCICNIWPCACFHVQ